MQKLTSPSEYNQIKIALEQEGKFVPFRGVLYIAWGVIIAKCVLIEWAFQRFSIPFSSMYLWGPTLLFACLATWVYARVVLQELRSRPLTGKFVSAIWGGCVMAASLVGLAGSVFGNFNGYLLPAFFSVILGTGYFIHCVLDHRLLLKFAALGWWGSAIFLFSIPNLSSLAWFSLFIILFQVLPTTLLHVQGKKTSVDPI